jgi:hypothetical protein
MMMILLRCGATSGFEGICLISLIVAIIDVIETMIAMMIPKVGFCLMCEGFSFAQM